MVIDLVVIATYHLRIYGKTDYILKNQVKVFYQIATL